MLYLSINVLSVLRFCVYNAVYYKQYDRPMGYIGRKKTYKGIKKNMSFNFLDEYLICNIKYELKTCEVFFDSFF